MRLCMYVLLALFVVQACYARVAGAETTTYYGTDYCGSLTASGEALDCSAFTAAHPDYALGTLLEVCHVGCVTVRVTDRGPNLDITPAAAAAIGILDVGRVDAVTFIH